MKKKFIKTLFIFGILLLGICLIGVGTWYYLQSPINVDDHNDISVEVKSGTSSTKIGELLKEKGLIKSVTLFKIYLKINHVGSLKASTYTFQKSMSLEDIVMALEKGVINNDDAIVMVFRDGLRIPDYAKVIADSLNVDYDSVISVFQNREFVQNIMNDYWFLTDSVLDEDIYYPLEGYLAPDTYYFDKDASVDDVIIRMLDQMEKNLEKYKSVISKDPHYYLTMASIVQLEGTNTENRKMIVGVFEHRLASGYNLGSDVTTYYALQASMKEDLSSSQFATVNPYNTRGANMIGKMPVGPICSPNMSSIEASVSPTSNDYLFFVADKNGEIYYSKTNAEHVQKVAELKNNGLWIEFN